MSEPSARDQLRAVLDFKQRFPHYVFGKTWRSFLFFDSDRMFTAEFVRNTQALLEIEGAGHACIEALAPEQEEEPSHFDIDSHTSDNDYGRFLSRPAPAGWRYDFGPFGCMSSLGTWCMYCERNAEIAVLALGESIDSPLYACGARAFWARPLEDALAANWTHALSHRLREDWRVQLLKNYSSRR